jgi:hypothetical protein
MSVNHHASLDPHALTDLPPSGQLFHWLLRGAAIAFAFLTGFYPVNSFLHSQRDLLLGFVQLSGIVAALAALWIALRRDRDVRLLADLRNLFFTALTAATSIHLS